MKNMTKKSITTQLFRSTLLLISLLCVVGLVLGATLISKPAELRDPGDVDPPPFANNKQSPPSLAPMLEKVLPTVVSIEVEGMQVERKSLPDDLRFFFGPNFPIEQFNRRPFLGRGSGVIVDTAKGYVITNNHVIKGASKILILLHDGRQLNTKLVGSDEQLDIALLQLNDTKALHAIPIADSEKVRVGDFAVAIGNPFGLGQTATSGIISALGRSGLNLENVENFIQTDAAINSGNSGGALVNLRGELVGINTAILAPNGGNIGIGFAIPSNTVKNFVDQIVKYGSVRRVRLGISGHDLGDDVVSALNLDTQHGALVREVIAGSAAEKAGIRAGDVIVSIDGKPLRHFAELRAKIASMSADQTIKLGLIRGGKPKSVVVNLQFNDLPDVKRATSHPAPRGAEMHNRKVKNTKSV